MLMLLRVLYFNNFDTVWETHWCCCVNHCAGMLVCCVLKILHDVFCQMLVNLGVDFSACPSVSVVAMVKKLTAINLRLSCVCSNQMDMGEITHFPNLCMYGSFHLHRLEN